MAGMDSSGNFKYIGIVIGDISAIKRLYKRLKNKYQKLHMRDLYASKRRGLARDFRIEASRLGVESLRIKVNLSEVVRELWEEVKRKGSRRSKRAVYRLALKELESLLYNILISRKVNSVYIDRELQCLEFRGLKIILEGEASELADVVAHRVTRVVEIDLSDYLYKILLKKL